MSNGLPGKVISFYIVPLDPAYPDRSGRGTVRPDVNQVSKIFGIILNTDTENGHGHVLLKKKLDKFFGGWYRTKTLKISNAIELVFHKP